MGNTASTSGGELSKAAFKGDAVFISERMQQSRDAVLSARTGIFAGKKNLLHVACKSGQHQVVATIINPLLDAVSAEIESNSYPGAATVLLDNIINHQDSKGRTALLAACYYGELECAELLLEAGSNIFACDKDGNGVLHLAAVQGNSNIITSLLAKADAQAITAQLTGAVNLSGFSALHYAAHSGSAHIVRQLAVAGVDLLQASWGEYDRWLVAPLGSTALHVAAMGLKASACLAMLEVHALLAREWLLGSLMPADPRSKTTIEGHTPYHLAVWKGMPASCQLATLLNPRVAVQPVVQQDSLQQLAQLRRKGPVSLRIIAAEAAKHHLLRQLEALAKQHQQQKKLHAQQQLQQQLHHRGKQQQQQLHHRGKQQQQHRRLHSEPSHHLPLHRSTGSRQQLVTDPTGPDSSRGSSAMPTPGITGSAAAAVAAAAAAEAAVNCAALEQCNIEARSTLCSSASSCSKPCSELADAAAAAGAPGIALTPIDAAAAAAHPAAAGGETSLLPGAISGTSFTTATGTAGPAGCGHVARSGLVADRRMQQAWQQQEQQQQQQRQQVHPAAVPHVVKHIAMTCCEIEPGPEEIEAETVDDGNYCMVQVLTQMGAQGSSQEQGKNLGAQGSSQEQGKLQQDSFDDSAALLVHMLSPGSLVAASCGTTSCSSNVAVVSARRQHSMQRRRSSEPAMEEGNATQVTGNTPETAGAPAAAAGSMAAAAAAGTPGLPEPTKTLTRMDCLQHSSLPVVHDGSSVLSRRSNLLSRGSAILSLSASSSNNTHKPSFRSSIPQLDLSRVSRGAGSSAAAGPAMFSASREQYVRMMQEAHVEDPRTLSYRTLAHRSRTGSMTAATALAGALPGCISDRLAHCYDSNSIMMTTAVSLAAGSAAETHRMGSAVSGEGLGGTQSAGSTIGGKVGSALGSTDPTRRVSAASSVACGEVCAVCMDNVPTVNIAECGHELCHECAKCIVGEGVGCRPPLCPFCRQMITGFGLVALPTRIDRYAGRQGGGIVSRRAPGVGVSKVAAA